MVFMQGLFHAIGACLMILSGLLFAFDVQAEAPPVGASPTAQNRDGKAVADEAFRQILEQGIVVSVPPAEQLKDLVEQQGADTAMLMVPVTLRATDTARAALEAAARELGGVALDAVLELDIGIASVKARAVRISPDPALLEYFQQRIASLVLRLDLVLDQGEVYECTTGSPWRLPVTPVTALFAYGGRPSIQGLGLSASYDSKDDGFVAARNDPMKVNFRAAATPADMARLQKIEARVVKGKGDEREGDCQKAKR